VVAVTNAVACNASQPQSPVGGKVAYDFGDRVELSELDGSHRALLVRTPRQRPGDLVWSPDGSAIALIRNSQPLRGRGTADLYVADVGKRTLRRLARLVGNIDTVRWSPDGRRLVFDWASKPPDCEFRSALFIANVTGGSPRPVRGIDQPDARRVLFYQALGWSPDGERILYGADLWDAECVLRDEVRGSVLHVRSRGSDPTVVSTSDATFGVRGEWSPDGRLIAFTGITPSTVSVARPAGREVRRFVGVGEEPLAWSRGGDEIFTTAQERTIALRVADGRRRTVWEYHPPSTCSEPDHGCSTRIVSRSSDGRFLLIEAEDADYDTGADHVVVATDGSTEDSLPHPEPMIADLIASGQVATAFFLS
jgi:Tol biopolymer transport system component